MQQPESFPEEPNVAKGQNGDTVYTDTIVPDENAARVSIEAAPSTGKWLLLLVVLLTVGLAGGFIYVRQRRARQESDLAKTATEDSAAPTAVDVVNVEYAPATHDMELPGECRAWYETTIYARVSGYVKKWTADIGDHVKEGQSLAVIETPELDQQLAASIAKVESDKAQIRLAKATMNLSESTLARYKDAPKGVVSDIERDEKTSDVQTSQAKLAAAESDLGSAQAQVDQIRAMIAFQKVIAPFDGTIAERRVDIGDLVTAGSTASTTPLFRLQQSDQIRVFVEVPESAVPEIHDGDKAIAMADEFPGRTFVGKVSRNSGAINNSSKTLRLEVDIDNKDMTLLPGMYVKVRFEMRDAHPNLQIPASALAMRSTGPEVAVVAKNGRVAFKKVTIVRDLGDVIDVSGDLATQDRVALNISDEVATGDMVDANVVDSSPSPTPVPPHAVTSAMPVGRRP